MVQFCSKFVSCHQGRSRRFYVA